MSLRRQTLPLSPGHRALRSLGASEPALHRLTFAGLRASLSRSVWAFRSRGTRRCGVVAESRPRATAQSSPLRPSATPPSRRPRGRRSRIPRSSAPKVVESKGLRPLCSSFPQGRRPPLLIVSSRSSRSSRSSSRRNRSLLVLLPLAPWGRGPLFESKTDAVSSPRG